MQWRPWPEVLNLAPVSAKSIPRPRLGDMLLDNGSVQGDGKPCLVFYDGTTWKGVALRE